MPLALATELSEKGIAPMAGLDDALSAFEAAALIGRSWAQTEDPIELPPPRRSGKGERTLGEWEAKRLLQRCGLAIPKGVVVPASEVGAAADALGYPVVLKISSSEIAHKTEAGGVALNLTSRQEVEEAADRLSRIAPELIVERMVRGAVAELIVGLKADPQFGVALVIGAGGVLAELLKDTVSLLVPTNRSEVEAALRSLRVWRLIEGFRGERGDVEAVVSAVEAVARFAEANPGLIEELDINPLLVLPQGAVAVDALIRMRTP
jgi:acetyl-CoA synthetase